MTSLADGFLGAALARFHARYPNIDVKLEEATAQMNVAGVISGRLDIAFVAGEIGRAHAELQSLMRISYAVFCLQQKITTDTYTIFFLLLTLSIFSAAIS